MNVTFFQWIPSSVCAAPAIVRFSTCTLSVKRREEGGSRISARVGMFVASRRSPPSAAGLSSAPVTSVRGAPTNTQAGAELFADADLDDADFGCRAPPD